MHVKTAKTIIAILIMAGMPCFFPVVVRADMFVDETGRRVDIPGCPKRIVSLAPNITETLYALDLGEKIVGVTIFSDYPEEARRKPKVGSYINLSLEKIVSLAPDLVIGTASGNKKETVMQLESLEIPVYIINPSTFEDIFKTVENIGRITGRTGAAQELVADLKKRVETVVSMTRDLKKPRVFFQIGIRPIVTVGKHTFHHLLIKYAGGINVAGDTEIKYPRLSIEKIIFAKPDIIIVSSMKQGGNFGRVKAEWKKWKDIPAAINDRIYVINSDLTDHSSPRIVDGLEELVKILHPDINKMIGSNR